MFNFINEEFLISGHTYDYETFRKDFKYEQITDATPKYLTHVYLNKTIYNSILNEIKNKTERYSKSYIEYLKEKINVYFSDLYQPIVKDFISILNTLYIINTTDIGDKDITMDFIKNNFNSDVYNGMFGAHQLIACVNDSSYKNPLSFASSDDIEFLISILYGFEEIDVDELEDSKNVFDYIFTLLNPNLFYFNKNICDKIGDRVYNMNYELFLLKNKRLC